MKRLSAVLALFALIVAGCGGGGGSSAGLPAGGVQAGMAAGSATLVIPNSATTTSATTRQPRFISTSATSVKISVPTLADQIFSIASGSTNCTTANNARTCTLAFTATAGQPAITVTLYDGANATGNVLGSAAATPSVTAGVPFTVNLTIGGTIKTVTINLSSGFTMGTAGSATVTVTAVDADGNPITGTANFSQPITLINTDTSGAFNLSGTTIASPAGTVTLTYSGAAVSSTVMINGSVPLAGVQVNSAQIFGGGSSPAPLSCGSPIALPATVTTVVSFGLLSNGGSTYTATTSSTLSTWSSFQYTAGTPSPTPTTTAVPTAGPTSTATPGQPVYFYEGTYQLQSGSSGCSLSIVTQDGSPLASETAPPEAGQEGLVDALPNLPGNANVVITSAQSGHVSSLVINGLGTSGGAGTIALDNGDTGTITFTTRFSSTLDKARKMAAALRHR